MFEHLETAYTTFLMGGQNILISKRNAMVVVQNLPKSAFKFRDGQVYLAKSTQALPIRWSRTLPDGASTINLKREACTIR